MKKEVEQNMIKSFEKNCRVFVEENKKDSKEYSDQLKALSNTYEEIEIQYEQKKN